MTGIALYPMLHPVPKCLADLVAALDTTPFAAVNVEKQFDTLTEVGDFLAAWPAKQVRWPRYRALEDENHRGFQNHFQGIQRLPGGYVVITGSDPYESMSHLFVVRMSSRLETHCWGSNLMLASEPPEKDAIVATVGLDRTLWHAGGMGLLGNILGVPLENAQRVESRIAFYDMRDPLQPAEIDVSIPRPTCIAGAVAMTRLADGRFVAAVWSDSDPNPPRKHLDLYLSRTSRFLDGFDEADKIVCDEGVREFPAFQTIAFVWEGDQALYLMGFDSDAPFGAAPTVPGTNRAHLCRIDLPAAWVGGAPGAGAPSFGPLKTRSFVSMGQEYNMRGAAGIHIARNGQLLAYSAYPYITFSKFWAFPRREVVRFAEFRSTGGFHAPVVDRVDDAWVELYDGQNFRGRHLTLMGASDPVPDYGKVRAQGRSFGSMISSVRFQIPTGFGYALYQRKNFGGSKTLVLAGTGNVIEVPDLNAHGFNDAINSSRFVTEPVAATLPNVRWVGR